MLRCPLCAGLAHSPLFDGYLRCNLCALGFSPGSAATLRLRDFRVSEGEYVFPNWNNIVSRVLGRSLEDRATAFLFSPVTVGILAVRDGYRVEKMGSSVLPRSVFLSWSRGFSIHVRLRPLQARNPEASRNQLTLGVIAAGDGTENVVTLCRDLVDVVAGFVVVLDTDREARARALQERLGSLLGDGRAQVLAHPLQNDFARQRNLVQHAARTEWVLHLDCDERLSEAATRRLPALLEEAEASGWAVMAFPRLNLVDGEPSAFYPDIQYRLLRRSVGFTGAVHEHPDLSPRDRCFVALGCGIVHFRQAESFSQRAEFYETINRGAGRPHDYELLRMPMEEQLARDLELGSNYGCQQNSAVQPAS